VNLDPDALDHLSRIVEGSRGTVVYGKPQQSAGVEVAETGQRSSPERPVHDPTAEEVQA
jgi:hypothetical protein